jgi:LmbE family N-acetylglucosaminyl deacetylase
MTDHRFVFRRPAAAAQFSVSLGDGSLEIPRGAPTEGTAFLLLHVETAIRGRLRDPSIEVRRGRCRYRQYFDRGASGHRYLNLTPVIAHPDVGTSRHVQLRGYGTRWKRQASLLGFPNPSPLEGQTVLVLAPHPDDAEIAAFGFYASRPSDCCIVTVTAGEHGMPLPLETRDPEAQAAHKADLRVWDSLAIPQLGGIPAHRCVNLVFPDRALEGMFRDRTRPARLACEARLPRRTLRSRNADPDFATGSDDCTWTGLVADLASLLQKVRPSIVVAPHPIIDSHPDHIFTTVALEEAMRRGGCDVRLALLYVVHPPRAPLHPFGSADSVASLPPWHEDEWVADSIWSHSLTPELRQRKYFAIEAAHDLRTMERSEPRRLGPLLASLAREARGFVRGRARDPASFLRRAPRPNEIFYVASPDSLSELAKRRFRQFLMQ